MNNASSKRVMFLIRIIQEIYTDVRSNSFEIMICVHLYFSVCCCSEILDEHWLPLQLAELENHFY